MKKRTIQLFVALVAIGSLAGCKKGENDPFLSLRSRKARLVGKWELTEGFSNIKNIEHADPEDNYTTSIKWENGTETEVYSYVSQPSGEPVTITEIEKYTFTIEFKKDGTYIISTTNSSIDDGSTSSNVYDGVWSFLGKSKNADLKNKEAISLQPRNRESNSSSENSSYYSTSKNQKDSDASVLYLDRLTNKELVIKSLYKSTDSESEFTNETEQKFKAKK